jgi:hypothetical protein
MLFDLSPVSTRNKSPTTGNDFRTRHRATGIDSPARGCADWKT